MPADRLAPAPPELRVLDRLRRTPDLFGRPQRAAYGFSALGPRHTSRGRLHQHPDPGQVLAAFPAAQPGQQDVAQILDLPLPPQVGDHDFELSIGHSGGARGPRQPLSGAIPPGPHQRYRRRLGGRLTTIVEPLHPSILPVRPRALTPRRASPHDTRASRGGFPLTNREPLSRAAASFRASGARTTVPTPRSARDSAASTSPPCRKAISCPTGRSTSASPISTAAVR